jgi:hypothetical protein
VTTPKLSKSLSKGHIPMPKSSFATTTTLRTYGSIYQLEQRSISDLFSMNYIPLFLPNIIPKKEKLS